MKISCALSILILVLAAGLAWHNHQRRAALRDERESLLAQAASRGSATGSSRPTKLFRRIPTAAHGKAEAQRMGANLMAYAVEMDALKLGSYPEDAAIRQRIIEQMDQVLALDAEQWKVVVEEIANAEGLPKHLRNSLLRFAIEHLTRDHPDQAMVHLIDSPGLLEKLNELANGSAANVVMQAMTGWGRENPTAALAWYQANVNRLSEDLQSRARSSLIRGAAVRDPRRALGLAQELGEEPGTWILPIARAADTPDGRSAALAVLREWNAPSGTQHEETLGEAFRSLAFGNRHYPRRFEPTAAWIERSGFSTAELAGLTEGIENFVRLNESGDWIEWLGANFPEKVARERTVGLMDKWVRSDYPAAGDWLAAAPEGPAKEAAVLAYAEAVSSRDPQAAVEWLLTLPVGAERDRALRQFSEHSPAN